MPSITEIRAGIQKRRATNETKRQENEIRRQERATRLIALTQQANELTQRMATIELFPGSVGEFESLKEVDYTIVDVPGPGKFITGTSGIKYSQAYVADTERGLQVVTDGSILENAVRVDADAIVHYAPAPFYNSFGILIFMGVPIREVRSENKPDATSN